MPFSCSENFTDSMDRWIGTKFNENLTHCLRSKEIWINSAYFKVNQITFIPTKFHLQINQDTHFTFGQLFDVFGFSLVKLLMPHFWNSLNDLRKFIFFFFNFKFFWWKPKKRCWLLLGAGLSEPRYVWSYENKRKALMMCTYIVQCARALDASFASSIIHNCSSSSHSDRFVTKSDLLHCDDPLSIQLIWNSLKFSDYVEIGIVVELNCSSLKAHSSLSSSIIETNIISIDCLFDSWINLCFIDQLKIKFCATIK